MLLDGINAIRACHHKEGHPHHHPHAGDAPVETHSHGGREIKVVRRVLDANDIMARANRHLFKTHRVFVLNLMSSPGSGKTYGRVLLVMQCVTRVCFFHSVRA